MVPATEMVLASAIGVCADLLLPVTGVGMVCVLPNQLRGGDVNEVCAILCTDGWSKASVTVYVHGSGCCCGEQ